MKKKLTYENAYVGCKRCPHCGSKASVGSFERAGQVFYRIGCRHCGCGTDFYTTTTSPRFVRQRWNRRANQERT